MKDNILNNILIPDKFSLDGIEPNMIEWRNSGKSILTIHADGRITVSEDCKPTETAAEVLRIMRDQWLADVQCAKIREQEERIKRLEEAGNRAIENSYYPDRVKVWTEAKEAKP
jgi:hypothetical protein